MADQMEPRMLTLREVAAFVRQMAADPKWSPSSDGELEHFAGHLADYIENDWLEEGRKELALRENREHEL